MAMIEHWVRHDVKDLVVPRRLDYYLFQGDEEATLIGVEVVYCGESIYLGEECVGYFVTPDGETHEIEGHVDGNRAYVVLGAECCAAPGAVHLVIKVDGVSFLSIEGYVYKTVTEDVIDLRGGE